MKWAVAIALLLATAANAEPEATPGCDPPAVERLASDLMAAREPAPSEESRFLDSPSGACLAAIRGLTRTQGALTREARLYDEQLGLLWRQAIHREVAAGAARRVTRANADFSASGDHIEVLVTHRLTAFVPKELPSRVEETGFIEQDQLEYCWSETERRFARCELGAFLDAAEVPTP